MFEWMSVDYVLNDDSKKINCFTQCLTWSSQRRSLDIALPEWSSTLFSSRISFDNHVEMDEGEEYRLLIKHRKRKVYTRISDSKMNHFAIDNYWSWIYIK